MASKVATKSFCWHTGGNVLYFRKDVTLCLDTDPVFTAIPSNFRDAGGAKTANASFVLTSGGQDLYYRKDVTKVAVGDAGFVAVPSYFT